MKSPGMNLSNNCNKKDCEKNRGADQIAEIHRHCDCIAPGFAERGAKDLNDPEDNRDFGNLTQRVLAIHIGIFCRKWHFSSPREIEQTWGMDAALTKF